VGEEVQGYPNGDIDRMVGGQASSGGYVGSAGAACLSPFRLPQMLLDRALPVGPSARPRSDSLASLTSLSLSLLDLAVVGLGFSFFSLLS
jgi:hypothetical protein